MRDVAKYYGDVPGWHYWFERRRQLWHAERDDRTGSRISAADRETLKTGMLTYGRADGCLYTPLCAKSD
jgi:hypothetical protein